MGEGGRRVKRWRGCWREHGEASVLDHGVVVLWHGRVVIGYPDRALEPAGPPSVMRAIPL